MDEPVVLKKYTNRRLYDTGQSAYVTLDQVAEMIKAGRTIEIIDEKTKEDVTGFILTQIMLEESKKNAMWPVSLLHIIIRHGDNILSDFFGKYLEQTIEVYISSKKAFDDYFSQWLEMGMNVSGKQGQPFPNTHSFPSIFNPLDSGKSVESEKKRDKDTE